MRRLGALTERIPPAVLFLAAGLLQIALIALLVIDRASILRNGIEVTLQTGPVDPRDFLRGDYVSLSYRISRISAYDLWGKPSEGRNTTVYVKLAPDADGVYSAKSVSREPITVTGGEVTIRGRATRGADCGSDRRTFCPNDLLTVSYGIERYFVPEGEGRVIEQARGRRLQIVAAVTPSGRAAIKRLLIDGKPVYAEPLY